MPVVRCLASPKIGKHEVAAAPLAHIAPTRITSAPFGPDFNLDIGLGQTRDDLNGSRNHPGLDESLVDVVTDRKTRMSRYGERFPVRDKADAANRLRRTECRSTT